MSKYLTSQHLAYTAGAMAILFGSVVMYAPPSLADLWILKSATFGFSQIALLLVNPDKAISAMQLPKV